jgi:heme-degrading monooxygenase HmoA
MARKYRMHKGQAVWLERRVKAGKQPNGVIIYLDWESREAFVKFFDEPPERETIEFDELEGNWLDTKTGGHWHVEHYE